MEVSDPTGSEGEVSDPEIERMDLRDDISPQDEPHTKEITEPTLKLPDQPPSNVKEESDEPDTRKNSADIQFIKRVLLSSGACPRTLSVDQSSPWSMNQAPSRGKKPRSRTSAPNFARTNTLKSMIVRRCRRSLPAGTLKTGIRLVLHLN